MFLIISFILLFLAFFYKKDNYILNHFLFGYFVIYVFFNLYFNCYSYLSINYHDMFYLYFILFVIIGFILFEIYRSIKNKKLFLIGSILYTVLTIINIFINTFTPVWFVGIFLSVYFGFLCYYIYTLFCKVYKSKSSLYSILSLVLGIVFVLIGSLI